MIVGVLLISFLGRIFAPLLAGLVIAYLLDAIVQPLQKWCRLPRMVAVTFVYLLFIGIVLLAVFGLLPLL